MASSTTVPPIPAQVYPLEKYEYDQQALPTPSENSKDDPKEPSSDDHLVEGEWVTGLPLFSILGAICLVCFLMLLDISIIVTAIPQITSDLHSLEDVGWYGSAYQLARCVHWFDFSFELTKSDISAAFLPLTGKIYVNFTSKVSGWLLVVGPYYWH